MTDDKMIEDAARAVWDHMDYGGVPSRMPQWHAQGPVTKAKYRRRAKAALESLGISLEMLSALKTGTWQIVPVAPTEAMLDALWDGQCPDAELIDLWAKVLAAAAADRAGGS